MSKPAVQPLMPEDELQALLAEASALTPDERVTKFLSRDVALPHTGQTAVLITLDNGEDHTKPNTLGPRSLSLYNDALNTALARDDVAAIAITGKPFILAAGADLKALGGLTGRDQAVKIAQLGHAVFDKLHTSPVPTFAFINGMALGGGLEIALHADYRTVSKAAAGIALPECFLGLLPGWGGTYLLPNLIGADRAVQVLAFLDHFGLDPASDRINPYGGAIALGHPLASSGVRLMIHLARQFREHPEIRYGLTTMCIGLGMGGTLIWENPHHTEGADK